MGRINILKEGITVLTLLRQIVIMKTETFRNCFVLEKLSLHSKFRPSDFSNNYIDN